MDSDQLVYALQSVLGEKVHYCQAILQLPNQLNCLLLQGNTIAIFTVALDFH